VAFLSEGFSLAVEECKRQWFWRRPFALGTGGVVAY